MYRDYKNIIALYHLFVSRSITQQGDVVAIGIKPLSVAAAAVIGPGNTD